LGISLFGENPTAKRGWSIPAPIVGRWQAPNPFWEAGMVGQVLYLEAKEAGVRSTGIGCSSTIQPTKLLGPPRWSGSVYHFTVGGPVEDLRLTALPAYGPEVDR
jgi:hypothetical protein